MHASPTTSSAHSRKRRYTLVRLIGIGATSCLIAASCRSAPVEQGSACTGQSTLVVRNESGRPFDVLVERGTAHELIGHAEPGRTEISLLSVNLSSARIVGRWMNRQFLGQHETDVHFDRECR